MGVFSTQRKSQLFWNQQCRSQFPRNHCPSPSSHRGGEFTISSLRRRGVQPHAGGSPHPFQPHPLREWFPQSPWDGNPNPSRHNFQQFDPAIFQQSCLRSISHHPLPLRGCRLWFRCGTRSQFIPSPPEFPSPPGRKFPNPLGWKCPNPSSHRGGYPDPSSLSQPQSPGHQ